MQAANLTVEAGAENAPQHHQHLEKVEIHVNRRRVQLLGHRHTGLEIKEAAISQGVPIQRDFLLYLLRHHEPNKLIADDEEIEVTSESHFHAIADDDNS